MRPVALANRSRRLVSRRRPPPASSRGYLVATAATVGALAIAAVVNRALASKAERDNPPVGRFIEVNGVRLHFLEHGSGEPLVLLHGNGSMIEDFESSGLIDQASKSYRVIVFDRPGFGHSDRPRNVVWTPEKQAALFNDALRRLGVSKALVLGHSWGASVAVALGLKYPDLVRGLVLVSGYYYPTARPDIVGNSIAASPVLGDIITQTLTPLHSRLMWPRLMRTIFAPARVPEKFAGFPKEMALRPSQLRAAAAESALMVPDAIASANQYADLKMPVVIVAGGEDRLIDTGQQSGRLHGDIPESRFHEVAGNGHMVHQTATEAVLAAIDEAADAGRVGTEKPSAASHAQG